MNDEAGKFTAPDAVNVTVAKIRGLPDKMLLTVWANGPQRFILTRGMADFLSKAISKTVAPLSRQSGEH